MPHNARGRTPDSRIKILRIMQANVGRSGLANDLALAMAFEQQTDMVLIQELWVRADLDRKMTKKHNAYQAYAPEEE